MRIRLDAPFALNSGAGERFGNARRHFFLSAVLALRPIYAVRLCPSAHASPFFLTYTRYRIFPCVRDTRCTCAYVHTDYATDAVTGERALIVG